MSLAVVTWKWGDTFSAVYVNRLQRALQRHLHLEHQVHCVTDNPSGLDSAIKVVPLTEYTDTPRCRRRMKQYDKAFARQLGPRILSIDLDVVITGDVTPLFARREPIVMWRVGYADVLSGSLVLYDSDALHGAYAEFARDPEGYPKRAWPRGIGSDQAMLNYWLRTRPPVPCWTERDGIITYFGEGYERFAHLGVGPSQPNLPPRARIVVLGSADKAAMDEGAYPWVKEHWSSLDAMAVPA